MIRATADYKPNPKLQYSLFKSNSGISNPLLINMEKTHRSKFLDYMSPPYIDQT